MTSEDKLRAMVIVNPASAAGNTGRRWEHTARSIRDAIGQFEYAFTEAPLHATSLANHALRNGFELIVAVGGDGTLNEVACGFFPEGHAVAPAAVLGVVAQGTGSDFVRTLGGPSLEEACARLRGGESRLIDVGHASFIDHDGKTVERVFLNVASFGCSGQVARMISPALKRTSGSLAFTLATLRTLLVYRDQIVSIGLDNELAHEYSITNCAFCNGQYFGGGMKVAPHALIDDGKFDLTLWSGFGLLDFIRKRRSLYSGVHIHEAGTQVFRASRATARSPSHVLLELDGESVGRLPAELKLLPRSLRVKVR
jgi:YegS/Rv2252/BmrU family lipid kinase